MTRATSPSSPQNVVSYLAALGSLALVAGCVGGVSGATGVHHHSFTGDAGPGSSSPPPSREICGNGLDDDGNGMVDEACSCNGETERSCYLGPPGTRGVGRCHDGSQLCDGAGEFAAWMACLGSVGPTREIAENGIDDNCDGNTDEPGGICVPSEFGGGHELASQCNDGHDNDCDTLRDCMDPDCHGTATCPATCAANETLCFGGVDDDCDGVTDCADPDCADALACQPSPCPAGETPTYRPRVLAPSGGGSSIEAGDGGAITPMTCEASHCDPGMVAVQLADGSLICVPPPPPCPAGSNPDYTGSGTWTCDEPCAYLVHYGGIYGGQTVCGGPPPPCADGTVPTFVFETSSWDCRPMCDGGLYDPHDLGGVLVCVPC